MNEQLLVVFVIILVLVLGINGILVLMLRRGKGSEHVDLWKKAVRRARDPWKDESEDLEELSDLVEKLKAYDERE